MVSKQIFPNQHPMLQSFVRSTRSAHFCTVPNSIFARANLLLKGQHVRQCLDKLSQNNMKIYENMRKVCQLWTGVGRFFAKHRQMLTVHWCRRGRSYPPKSQILHNPKTRFFILRSNTVRKAVSLRGRGVRVQVTCPFF